MQEIPFVKMQGTGNDFIMVDNRAGIVSEPDLSRFVREFCPRRIAIGADGAIFVEPPVSDSADFRMRYFNADGGEAEMCGNGSRCITLFANMIGAVGKKTAFDTMAGLVGGEILDNGEVKVKLSTPVGYSAFENIALSDGAADLFNLNTGVPHAVQFVDDVDATPVVVRGASIRYHERYQPAGTNANFVTRIAPSEIRIRTYERGVEDETLACGTGATAAALLTHLVFGAASPVTVHVRSGERLVVHFEKVGDEFSSVFLQGPVKVVYHGTLTF